MIKFFRRIRQNLLSDNKFSKYLVYAIGEIILVVIGILIALQINNWNSQRQLKNQELGFLKELKAGIVADKQLLSATLKDYKTDHKALKILDSLLKRADHPYSPGLDSLFGKVYGIRYIRLNSAFYEDLKTSGLQIIQDEKIRSTIVNLFENNYEIIETYLANERSVNQVTRPYYLENFFDLDFQDSATPNDYDKIWQDPKYKNIVHYRIITLEFNQLTEYPKAIDAIDDLMSQINNYIND